jgi:hypothetical protein
MEIPPHKKKPNHEESVRKLSADEPNVNPDGGETDSLHSDESEERYQKTGKFYKNLKPEVKLRIKSDTPDQTDSDQLETQRPTQTPNQLSWMMGDFPSKPAGKANVGMSTQEGDNAIVDKLLKKLSTVEAFKHLDPDLEVEDDSAHLTEDELQARRATRRAELKLKTNAPKKSDLDKEEMQTNDIEEDWEAEKVVTPIGWFVVLGVIICAVGGWAIYDVMQARGVTQDIVLENKLLLEDKEKEDQEVRDLLGDMQYCVSGYLAAGSVDAMLPFVRHPERVGPLMGEFYKTNKRWRRRFTRFEHIRAVSMGTRSFVYVKAEAEEGAAQNLFLEQLDDGSFRVDWESEVIYQPMPWKEYLAKRPLAPLDMRVLVQADDFYGFAFRDSKRYQCYKLTTAGSDDYLFGYVERGSQVALEMEELLVRLKNPGEVSDVQLEEKEEDEKIIDEIVLSDELLQEDEEVVAKAEAMILRLRFLQDDPSKRCVMIESLVAERWMYEVSP